MKRFWMCIRFLFVLMVMLAIGYFMLTWYYQGRCIEAGGAERAVVTLDGVYCLFYFEEEDYEFFEPLRELEEGELPPVRYESMDV